MTDGQPEKRDDEELTEEEAVERLRKLLGEEGSVSHNYTDDEPDSDAELEKIENRLAETAAETSIKASSIDDEFENRISSFSRKVDQARTKREAKNQEERRSLAGDADSAQGLGVGLSIAYTIIGFPLAGALVGYFVDQKLGTQVWKGFGLLIAAALAVFMSLLILRRSNTKK